MPTYEYECKKCGIFEEFQSISEKPLKTCPACKGTVKRLLGTGAGVIFKGAGFYETDYKRQGQTCSSKSSQDNSPKNENKPEKKAETKSESGTSSSDKKKKA